MEKSIFFDEMKSEELLDAFFRHKIEQKEPDNLIEDMRKYVTSQEYRDDLEKLKRGDYFFDIPIKKEIPKSLSTKKRIVYCMKGKEKIILQIMAYALHKYDSFFSDSVYSSILGKNSKGYFMQLKSNKQLGNMYAVKMDIQSYGHSIDIQTLVQKLELFFTDEPELFNFLKWLLERRKFIYNGICYDGNTAALPGIPIHSFFTNLYLLDMDNTLGNSCIAYCRYSDDILFFIEDFNEMEVIRSKFIEEITGHGLTLNEKKTITYEPGARIEHLGVCYEKGEIDISDYSLYKLKRKMRIRAKKIRHKIENGLMQKEEGAKLFEKLFEQTFFGRGESNELSWSRWLFPIITLSDGLHKLDVYNQHCLRYVLTGKWGPVHYRVKYDELKRYGYKSIVRRYYCEEEKAVRG